MVNGSWGIAASCLWAAIWHWMGGVGSVSLWLQVPYFLKVRCMMGLLGRLSGKPSVPHGFETSPVAASARCAAAGMFETVLDGLSLLPGQHLLPKSVLLLCLQVHHLVKLHRLICLLSHFSGAGVKPRPPASEWTPNIRQRLMRDSIQGIIDALDKAEPSRTPTAW